MNFVDNLPAVPVDNVNKKNQQIDLLTDPLLVEGTKKYIIDFTFKADFVNLLSFLRDLNFRKMLFH